MGRKPIDRSEESKSENKKQADRSYYDKYKDMLCGIEHLGYSAPASIAFLYSIPFLLGIIFNKKTSDFI